MQKEITIRGTKSMKASISEPTSGCWSTSLHHGLDWIKHSPSPTIYSTLWNPPAIAFSSQLTGNSPTEKPNKINYLDLTTLTAKPLFASSILARASKFFKHLHQPKSACHLLREVLRSHLPQQIQTSRVNAPGVCCREMKRVPKSWIRLVVASVDFLANDGDIGL